MTDPRDGPPGPESWEKSHPLPPRDADFEAAMERLDQGRAPFPESAGDPGVLELLAHWDELPEDVLERLARHPGHGPRLARLQAAERWLAGRTSGIAESCPGAEELYDFARGPGFLALPSARRGEIEEHLAACPACESLVESLATSPPLPLDLRGDDDEDGDEVDGDGADHDRGPTAKPQPRTVLVYARRSRAARWIPLAAAAAVLVTGYALFRDGSAVRADRGLPEYPLLRGASADALLFPRGKVLAADAAVATGPGTDAAFAAAPRFEVTPVEGATSYRFVLWGHPGGAFDEGEVLGSFESESAELVADHPLAAGHFTWEAWAVVDGLDRRLGARDFQVTGEPDDLAPLAGLADRDLSARVRGLHEAGFLTDARHLARSLPPGRDRDAYLGATPGR